MTDSEELDGEWVLRVNEVADNIFLVVDGLANVFIFNSEGILLERSKLRISDPGSIRFSKSKKLLGIGSKIDRNIVVLDIGLCFMDS